MTNRTQKSAVKKSNPRRNASARGIKARASMRPGDEEQGELQAFLSSIESHPYRLTTSGYYENIVGCTPQEVDEALDECRGRDEIGEVWRFCILSIDEGTYVQTACDEIDGVPTWRLEWRITEKRGKYRHCYAVQKNDPDPDGDMVLDLEIVKRVFHEFFRTGGRTMPTDEVVWHEMHFGR